MIGWLFRLLCGIWWPPNTPPAPAASDNSADNIPPNIPPVVSRRPAWMKGEGRPCPDCGVRLVDGECLACAAGWINA